MAAIAPWTLISPEAPLRVVAAQTLLVSPVQPRSDEVRVMVVELLDSVGNSASIRHAILGSTEPPRSETVPAWRRINEFCAEFFGQRIDHVLAVPPVEWSGRGGLFGPRTATAIQYEDDPSATFDPQQLIGRIAALPAPEGAPAREPAGAVSEAAQARVDAVKETFGELSADVVYRIENSALFDTSVELTRQFHLLLLRWEDDAARLNAAELDRLALEITLAFDTARGHAETVGLAHLPTTARATAGRAIKAAQLARAAATEGEREAAMAQVVRLLESIAVYYLPAAGDVPRMIGGAAPQLGRPA
ncbi:hypothetical protein [Tessaracoccus massiliensis]|uniref:hypothetical protein n=1 Tax=Tessaracoccus massiliensis TaxID=1522311 RepID=UPI001118EBB7|nr:hypothetical protein [Tessaracoccus massiliensis]